MNNFLNKNVKPQLVLKLWTFYMLRWSLKANCSFLFYVSLNSGLMPRLVFLNFSLISPCFRTKLIKMSHKMSLFMSNSLVWAHRFQIKNICKNVKPQYWQNLRIKSLEAHFQKIKITEKCSNANKLRTAEPQQNYLVLIKKRSTVCAGCVCDIIYIPFLTCFIKI